MLKQAYNEGVRSALARFGVKTAIAMPAPATLGQKALGLGKDIWQGLVGNPVGVGKEIYHGQAFKPGGALHWKSVFWPTDPKSHFNTWVGRLGTLGAGYSVYRALRGDGDPSKSTAENALGAIGEAAGSMYGFPLAGVFGAPHIARAGRALGESVGRVIGKRPEPAQEPAYPGGMY